MIIIERTEEVYVKKIIFIYPSQWERRVYKKYIKWTINRAMICKQSHIYISQFIELYSYKHGFVEFVFYILFFFFFLYINFYLASPRNFNDVNYTFVVYIKIILLCNRCGNFLGVFFGGSNFDFFNYFNLNLILFVKNCWFWWNLKKKIIRFVV